MLEPKSRTVDPGLLMESLFKLTELETRIPLNMNVLSQGQGARRSWRWPRCCSEWLDHRQEVLVRRSQATGSREIEHRLEVLGGYLIAYLNLDEVIRIIREEDEPKPVLMERFELTDVQAEAILNMRLRACASSRRSRSASEHDELTEEQKRARRRCSAREAQAVEDDRRRDQGGAREVRPEDASSAGAAPASPTRRSTTRPTSQEAMIERSRSPSSCPRRAGSAR